MSEKTYRVWRRIQRLVQARFWIQATDIMWEAQLSPEDNGFISRAAMAMFDAEYRAKGNVEP